MRKTPLLNDLLLKRVENKNGRIFGALYYDGVCLCSTLEPARFAIPLGDYSLDYTFSPKFGKNLPLLLVPHRSGIRIHPGNTIQDSRGCILVGTRRENQLVNSAPVMMALSPFLAHCSHIKIIEAYD